MLFKISPTSKLAFSHFSKAIEINGLKNFSKPKRSDSVKSFQQSGRKW